MKNQSQVRAKNNHGAPVKQSEKGRVKVKVVMAKDFSDAVDKQAKRLGLSRDELFERAIRAQVDAEGLEHPGRGQGSIPVLLPAHVCEALESAAKSRGVSRDLIVMEAVREKINSQKAAL